MKTITTLIIFIFIVNFSVAQPGTLDSSFGVNGTLAIENFAKFVGCIKVQADGKIIIGGESLLETILLARFNPDGNLDSTFGVNGIVTTDLVPNYQLHYAFPRDMTIQPDGKIVIAGSGSRKVGLYGDYDIFLARYNIDGSIDSSFGSNGVATNDFGDENEFVSCISLQPDGKILTAGFYTFSSFAVRYNSNGTLDSSFNGTGWAKYNRGFFKSINIQSDLKLILGGANTEESIQKFMIIRLQPNGKKDSSFGINGVVTTNIEHGGGEDAIYSMALQSDGKYIAGGGTNWYDGNMVLARYETNGLLDTSFGIDGTVITKIGTHHSFISKVLLQDGKIIAAGYARDFAVVKYNNDGSINYNFGDSGTVITYFGLSNGITDAALQSDGKIVGVGYSGYKVLLARYNNNEPVTISFRKNVQVTEGNSGIKKASFEILLNKISKKDVQVIAETKDVTAVAGEDYKPILRKVTIKAGSTSASIDVKIKGDTLTEGNEKFLIVLSNPVNAIIGKVDTAVCTIEDDDVLFAINASSFDNAVNNVTASIKIYPNPVNNHLLLSGLPSATKTTLSIIDMNGNSRLAATITGSSYNWNIGQLKAGNYILRIENGGMVVSKMFVKE